MTIDVAAGEWVDAARTARDDDGFDFFDWLSAVDDGDALTVVVHLWSQRDRRHRMLRTQVAKDHAVLASLTDIYAGANWHERETYEMFGVVFDGHPDLRPLLLPTGFSGQPLRKEFRLTARDATAWPGARDPGGVPPTRPMHPPGADQ